MVFQLSKFLLNFFKKILSTLSQPFTLGVTRIMLRGRCECYLTRSNSQGMATVQLPLRLLKRIFLKNCFGFPNCFTKIEKGFWISKFFKNFFLGVRDGWELYTRCGHNLIQPLVPNQTN